MPAQDMENWTFAALFPDDDLCAQNDYECIKSGQQRPCYRLTLKKYGKLLQRRGGEIKKQRLRYQQVIPQITANWNIVCRICSQAQQFTQDVQRFL
jgi:hypothetical protein